MLQSKWLSKKIKYDGSQLRSLFAYLDHGVMGDSLVAFRGPCNVSFSHMVDGEDLLAKEKICGDDMVHFIGEFFDQSLFAGVWLQRLFASIVADEIWTATKRTVRLDRKGDDLYWGGKKLSISIAARSVNSVMLHFAVNVTTAGTPVPTVGLKDFKIDAKKFAEGCLRRFSSEYKSVIQATVKVKSV